MNRWLIAGSRDLRCSVWWASRAIYHHRRIWITSCSAAVPVPICPPPPAEVQAESQQLKVVRFCRMALLRRDNRSNDHTRIRSHSAGLFCRPGRDSRPSGISTVPRTISSHSRAVWGPAGFFRGRDCPLRGLDGSTARAAIVVFPSLQAGRDWFESPTYQKIAPLRQRSARTRGFFVEGLPVPKQ